VSSAALLQAKRVEPTVAVVDKANVRTSGFLVAEFSDSSDAMIRAKVGLGVVLCKSLQIVLEIRKRRGTIVGVLR
jgi:glycosylphosphatidylinositol deacylase